LNSQVTDFEKRIKKRRNMKIDKKQATSTTEVFGKTYPSLKDFEELAFASTSQSFVLTFV